MISCIRGSWLQEIFFVRRWEALKNKQIWGRIGQIVLVLLGISFVTFALVMLSPGDPVRQMIAGNEDIVVSQVEIDALRHELGLDKPFIFQYLDWLGRAVQGDFGFSYMVKKPVVEELMQSLPATLILALASYVGVFTAFGYLFCCQTQQCF